MTRRARAPLDAGVGCWPPADAGTAWAGFVVRYVVDNLIYGPVNERRCTVSFAATVHSASINSQALEIYRMAIAPALMSLSCAGRIASVKISLGHVDHNVVGCICMFLVG